MSQDIVPNSDDTSDSYVFPVLSNSLIRPEPVLSIQKRTSNNKWDKKHCCKFCQKLVTKMSSHLQRVHKEEVEVAHVLVMTKGSIERRQAWTKLLN